MDKVNAADASPGAGTYKSTTISEASQAFSLAGNPGTPDSKTFATNGNVTYGGANANIAFNYEEKYLDHHGFPRARRRRTGDHDVVLRT